MEGEEATGTESINFTLNTQNGVNKTNENLMEEEEVQENVTEVKTSANICSLNTSTEEPEVQMCSNKTEITETLSVIEINERRKLTEIYENVCSMGIHEKSAKINIKEDSDKSEVRENFTENSTSTTEHGIPIENVGMDRSLDCKITISETVHNLQPNHSVSNVVRQTQSSCPSCSCVSHENGSFANRTFDRDSADEISYNHTYISQDPSCIPSAQEVNVIVEQDEIYRRPSTKDLPTYSSLVLNDEPPRYEDVTGIKLSMELVSVLLIYFFLKYNVFLLFFVYVLSFPIK